MTRPIQVFAPTYRGGDTFVTQQPNDAADAARLYGELQDKAEDKVISAMVEQVEPFKAEFVTYQCVRTPMDGQTHHRLAFKVNGHVMVAKVSEKEFERDGAQATLRQIAEAITGEILKAAVSSLGNSLHGSKLRIGG